MNGMLPAHEIYPHHLATLRAYAASGIKDIMEFAEYMKTVTDTFPDDLKPFGKALTDITLQALIESYFECLMLLQEITRAAPAPNHRIEQEK
jgi:hypothetical protein